MELEREVTKKIRNAKRGMEKKMAQCNDNNSRRFAYYIRSKTKTKTSIGPPKGKDGELVSDEKKMANELNAFFASVFTMEEVQCTTETTRNK